MNSSDVYAEAYDAISSGVADSFTGNTIPTHTTLDPVNGDAYSKNAIDWYVSGGRTILSLGMDHQRTGAQYSYASSYAILKFTANSNEPFDLSGYYDVSDVGANGEVIVNVKLTDLTSSAILFFNKQYSKSTPNEQFVLGGTGGDFSNTLTGGLTGNLIAGHNYVLDAYGQIQAYSAADSGATVLGNFTLAIGTPSGDFNDNGIRDAADFVVWRKNSYSADYYNLWRAQFGESVAGRGTLIPEPSSGMLCLAAIFATLMPRRRCRS
jgi:hypothetical protein